MWTMSKRKDRRFKRLQAADTAQKKEKSKKAPAQKQKVSNSSFAGLEKFYWNEYKKLLWIPFIILFLAMAQIGYQISTTGSFVEKGITLKGGVTVTVPGDVPIDKDYLEGVLQEAFSTYDVVVRGLKSATGKDSGVIVDADITGDDVDPFVQLIADTTLVSRQTFSVEEIGSSLGESFFKQTLSALLIAFFFMGIVVFLYFRVFMPCFAVILAAFSDIVVTLAVINILEVKLSTAGIAAFLMLIGYSIDTDMLLSIKVLKKKDKSLKERIYSSMKTGLTMSCTTLAAVLTILLFSKSDILTQIALIVFIGLLFDLIFTWIQNVGLLRMHVEGKQ